MGRPPLNLQRMHINLSPEDLDRIDAIAGPHGRSKFIREAVAQHLDRIAPADEAKGARTSNTTAAMSPGFQFPAGQCCCT